MSMRFRLTIIAILAFVSFGVSAQENIELAFKSELKKKNEAIESIKCKFTQTREVSYLAKPISKAGEFYYLKPNNMLLSFNNGEFIKMSGEWFEMKMAGNVVATKVSANPMLKNLNSILSACVVGDFDKMSSGFAVCYEQSDKEWTITLTPQHGKAAAKVSQIVVVFDKSDMSLSLLKVVEKKGDYTAYSFTNKQFNITIDTQIFNITK